MATFTEKSEYDKIEIIGDFKGVHVRKVNIVLKILIFPHWVDLIGLRLGKAY